MKTILLALLLLPFSLSAQADQFYVTFIKGSVSIKKTRQILKVGDKLSSSDNLQFKDRTCKLACISPGKGRFEINAEQTKPNEEGELLAVLKSSLLPSANTYHLSTRSLSFEGYDPKTYFQCEETNNRILLLIGKEIPISETYKNVSGNFFFIQYNYEGKTITKKIIRNDKGLLFNEDLFSDISRNLDSQKILLCFQSKESGVAKSTALAEFYPVLVNMESINEQVELLKKVLSGIDEKKMKSEIINHIYDNYGKIGMELLLL